MSTPDFEIKLETVLTHDDGEFLWFHPRVALIPSRGAEKPESVVMTLQKHLVWIVRGTCFSKTTFLEDGWSTKARIY